MQHQFCQTALFTGNHDVSNDRPVRRTRALRNGSERDELVSGHGSVFVPTSKAPERQPRAVSYPTACTAVLKKGQVVTAFGED
jgi:hypothetical protein